ncbi:tRNA (N(6)-L-threonylcarbamoyladenosine(37)-C(2))-methylthiotransferase MtaB [Treponema primitia]|uniref:tRNA (N(6)-L-threonylcarbamoyladenosine(37)-C(2))- methylthiotransferase MtaB n=1 Tax=Treponema primitia TaxID=88058 RepID=UPI000255580E|nr:tRNA (N(6)-L-threonylcarbamoyladenosine(37)-C(2))-methylthiotransferase MtaB [Treponema primitia]
MVSASIQTLGCKLNQIEGESIAEAFSREGFSVSAGDFADILVINTCTVTSKSEQKARRLIRKALKDNPRSCIIVTGCYAQVEADAIAALEEGELRRLFVLTGDRKTLLLDLPRYLRDTPDGSLSQALERYLEPGRAVAPPDSGGMDPGDPFRFNVTDLSFHSRPFMKIQDGCNHACSYCRVSLARGPSVSLDAETLLSRLRALENAGHGEAVLTGVNLNQYRSSGLDLGGILEYLLANTQTIALRLSSLEPDGMTEPFLRVLSNQRIRPHFHLSIQSGSPQILERMRRNYGPETVENAVRCLRALREDPFLACDIITGFPGETPEEFAKTHELCRRAGFAWIHAFPYSRRPGTEAWNFTESVPEREAVSRVESLINLGRQGRAAYISRWAGKTVEAIAEDGRQGDAISALSENYLKLRLPLQPGQPLPPPGTVLRCRILGPLEPVEPHFDAIAELKS